MGARSSRQNTIHEVVSVNATDYVGNGDITAYISLANVWADIDLPNIMSGATPYIGGGLGVAVVDNKLVYTGGPA